MDKIVAHIQIDTDEINDDSPIGLQSRFRPCIFRRFDRPRPQPAIRRTVVFVLGLLLLLEPRVGIATSVAATWMPTEVILAADSKISGSSCKQEMSACKIERAGDIIFAFAGPSHVEAEDVKIESMDAVIRSALKGVSLDEAVRQLDVLVPRQLRKVIEVLNRAIAENVPVGVDLAALRTQIILTSIRTMGLSQRDYRPIALPNGTIDLLTDRERMDCPGSQCPPVPLPFVPTNIGLHHGIDALFAATPGFLRTIGTLDLVQLLVQTEIDDPVDQCHVGPPIDILRLTGKGPCWMRRKPSCDQGIPMCPDAFRTPDATPTTPVLGMSLEPGPKR